MKRHWQENATCRNLLPVFVWDLFYLRTCTDINSNLKRREKSVVKGVWQKQNELQGKIASKKHEKLNHFSFNHHHCARCNPCDWGNYHRHGKCVNHFCFLDSETPFETNFSPPYQPCCGWLVCGTRRNSGSSDQRNSQRWKRNIENRKSLVGIPSIW